ncbi:hypothetical protein ACQ7NK_07800 [Escherichia coli]
MLYLDCDVICNGPLDELVDYNLNADIAWQFQICQKCKNV